MPKQVMTERMITECMRRINRDVLHWREEDQAPVRAQAKKYLITQGYSVPDNDRERIFPIVNWYDPFSIQRLCRDEANRRCPIKVDEESK